MSFGEALLMLVIGFWWGEWLADRRAEKERRNGDAAFKLLYGMVTAIIEKRQFVGRAMTITRREEFEIKGERFTLSLHSEGDPSALPVEERL